MFRPTTAGTSFGAWQVSCRRFSSGQLLICSQVVSKGQIALACLRLFSSRRRSVDSLICPLFRSHLSQGFAADRSLAQFADGVARVAHALLRYLGRLQTGACARLLPRLSSWYWTRGRLHRSSRAFASPFCRPTCARMYVVIASSVCCPFIEWVGLV